jgi:hypothetical protein
MAEIADTRSGRVSAKISGKAKLSLPTRRHVTQGSSASEIRKALGISKRDLDAARRDLAALSSENKKL